MEYNTTCHNTINPNCPVIIFVVVDERLNDLDGYQDVELVVIDIDESECEIWEAA